MLVLLSGITAPHGSDSKHPLGGDRVQVWIQFFEWEEIFVMNKEQMLSTL